MAHLEDRWTKTDAHGKKYGTGLRWRVRYRDPAGAHRSKSFARKDDADRFLHDLSTKVATGEYVDPKRGKITLDDITEPFLETIKATRKIRTWASYEEVYHALIQPTWGNVAINAIEHVAVQRWVNQMVDRGMSPSRVRHAARLLKAILETGVRDRRMTSNPARGLSLPSLPMKGEHIYLTHQQLRALAFACGSYRGLINVLGMCGLRWGEAVGLKVDDIDFDKRRIYVRRSLVDVKGQISEGTPKTHERRWVPMPDPVRDSLINDVEGKTGDEYVFTSPHGGPMRLSNWRRTVFDPAARSLDLDGLKPHSLRHTAAALAVRSGASVKDVQRMHGHKRASMTLDVYSDIFEDDLDDLAKRMSDAAREAE